MVNARCDHGHLRVALLDGHMQPFPGFGAEDCDPVHGPVSRIWHAVSWRGRQDASELWDKPVRIRFELHESELYGFRFE